jgi:hypothetical protein
MTALRHGWAQSLQAGYHARIMIPVAETLA